MFWSWTRPDGLVPPDEGAGPPPPIPPLYVPCPAEDLDGVRRDLHGHVRGVEFRDARLLVHRHPLVEHPRGPPREEARGIDLRLHVREEERDRLLLRDGPAEGLPHPRVVEGVLVRRPGDPDRARGDDGPRGLAGLHRAVERGGLVAPEHVPFRDAAVLEDDLRRVACPGAPLVLALPPLLARGVFLPP